MNIYDLFFVYIQINRYMRISISTLRLVTSEPHLNGGVCPESRKRVILHILVIYYFTVIYCKFVGTQMKLVNTFTCHLNM